MTGSDTLWEIFRTTGYIGAYLLYRNSLQEDDLEAEGEMSQLDEQRGVAGI